MRQGFEPGAQGIGVHQLAFAKCPMSSVQMELPHGVKGGFHGVKGRGATGQNRVFNQGVKSF